VQVDIAIHNRGVGVEYRNPEPSVAYIHVLQNSLYRRSVAALRPVNEYALI
jgi:hypothetical protein